MTERPASPEPVETRETVEQKKERLGPAFLRSQEVFRDPERPLREGAINVQVERGGELKTIPGLIAIEVSDDAVELGAIEDDGEMGPSGSLAWEDIVDVK